MAHYKQYFYTPAKRKMKANGSRLKFSLLFSKNDIKL